MCKVYFAKNLLCKNTCCHIIYSLAKLFEQTLQKTPQNPQNLQHQGKLHAFILHSIMLCNTRLSNILGLKCAQTILQTIIFVYIPHSHPKLHIIHHHRPTQHHNILNMSKTSENSHSVDETSQKSPNNEDSRRSPSIPPHGTKEWFIPREMSGFTTYIDHNCTNGGPATLPVALAY